MEIWKEIDEIYDVSSYGRVRSKMFGKFKIMKQQPNRQNRLTVCLTYNKKQKRRLVSRLVAESFIPNPNNYPIVMHKDDNPTNNNVDNLMWGTQKMNMHDMLRKGRSKRIFTNEIVKYIKETHYKVVNQYEEVPIGKLTTTQLAKKFGVRKHIIINLIKEKTYKEY